MSEAITLPCGVRLEPHRYHGWYVALGPLGLSINKWHDGYALELAWSETVFKETDATTLEEATAQANAWCLALRAALMPLVADAELGAAYRRWSDWYSVPLDKAGTAVGNDLHAAVAEALRAARARTEDKR